MRTSLFLAAAMTAACSQLCSPALAWVDGPLPLLRSDTEFVILTHPGAVPAFERLAAARTEQGIRAEVVVVSGHDPAAIREALRQAYVGGALRAVLFGGTPDLVPTRTVMRASPTLNFGDSIPTDLYYAALDGNWDADGDRVFGELPWRGSDQGDPEDDQVDLVPELQIGRVPTRTEQESAIFVSKVLSVDGFAAEFAAEYHRTLLLVASAYPVSVPIFHDLAEKIVMVRGWEASDYTWLESGSDLAPPVQPLSIEAASRRWNESTQGLILHLGTASHDGLGFGSIGDGAGRWTPDDTRALTNVDLLPLLVSLSAPGSFDDDAVAADAVLQPVAGAAGAVAFTAGVFAAAATELAREFVVALGELPTVGEAFLAAQRRLAVEFEGDVRSDGLLAWTLIGDPTMPSPTYEGERFVGAPPVASRVRAFRVQPNPFNPRTSIRLEVDGNVPLDARIDVFDLRGRKVRTLFDGVLESGARALDWDGRDDGGVASASGIYAVRLEAGSQVMQRKVTLVR